jgi:gamma-glutamylcyclotransferase (GGCT)/AIG2-like uncharacterized protein YtfP
MEQLFTYGSLQNADVQETIFGRKLEGKPEILVGYTVKEISIEEEFGMEKYPIIVPTQNEEDTISGILYELSPSDLQKTDTYEGYHYKRIQVALESKQTAWVYTAKT